jgi:Ca-activated chloride channel family protein
VQDTENYQTLTDNPVRRAGEHPVSTFSIDVDTGSYANVRRFLNAGQLPPEDAVRVEEMLNYFDYDYPVPASRNQPFRVSTELARTPWNPESQLLRIGIKGYAVSASERPASNLVFLVDVSGSMRSADKLPLLKNAFRLLTQQLSAADRVSLVVYAGATGVVLEPTAGDRKQTILGKIAGLEAGGSTNGGAGIDLAYSMARQGFIEGGINRVILATDGDFNVGTVSFEALLDKVERERSSGVALTTLGFGTGNYNEKLLERLADAGNGNYAYLDTLPEARKVLVEELSSTLFTIARDVKIQVEFNPAVVAEYRLIGYENRMLAREDFNNDKVDAGDIGAGHRVTALYEVVPVGKRGLNDPLRYGGKAETKPAMPAQSGELAFVRLRYKAPDSAGADDASKLIEFPVQVRSLLAAGRESSDFRFAASVAAFGQKLRGGKYLGAFGYGDIRKLAAQAAGDKHGYRREFLALLDLAETLQPSVADTREPGIR